MTPTLSPNTQAILLLTAPLILGRTSGTKDLLTPGEYKRLARHLLDIKRQPADLCSSDADDVLRACHAVIDEGRLRSLLARGFLLSQVVDHWKARAIWVVSRADPEYPRRFKTRFRENAPALIYGCGDTSLLDSAGLAVVGSRRVSDSLIDYTEEVGRLTAHAGGMLISGGAKGVDLAAMRGALAAGGKVCGVLADSLERTAMTREHRNHLVSGQLVLISPYDPSAKFHQGLAMQRNKLIYALADAALVVNSAINEGGTWTGAVEQLEKHKFIPVLVRSTGESSEGLEALKQKGAMSWPNPKDVTSFAEVFNVEIPKLAPPLQGDLSLFSSDELPPPPAMFHASTTEAANNDEASASDDVGQDNRPQVAEAQESTSTEATPAEELFAAARAAILRVVRTPAKDAEVAAALDVSTTQVKAWLQRLVDEGVLERQKKPAAYVVKSNRLFK